MAEKLMEVQLSSPERSFTKVYKDFLCTPLLSTEEKMVYIALKSFVTYGTDSGQVYPSMETLCKMASLSRPRATRAINSLIKKGIVEKKRRGLNKTNLYTLKDNAAMWRSDNADEMKELASSSIELSNEELIEELQRRGIEVTITGTKKEPVSDTDQSTDTDTSKVKNISFTNKFKAIQDQSQETYTQQWIKNHYSYEDMIIMHPELQRDIDGIMNLLYDTLNTKKDTIRISQEDKPAKVVISKLLKLTADEIVYSIDQYCKQTEKISSHTSYMLTLLYKAKEQFNLDMQNRVKHDLYGGAD